METPDKGLWTCRTPGCGGPTSHLACHRELARILAMMRNLIGTKAFGGWFRCVNRMAFVTVLAAVWAESRCPASDLQTKQLPVLTTARQVHGLTVEQASLGYPVRLRGVVTFWDPYQEGHRALFIADSTGGVFVAPGFAPNLPLHAGSLVEVSGVSDPGGYSPMVTNSSIRILPGTKSLPAARAVALAQLLNGSEDCQWVALRGIVRSVELDGMHVVLTVATADGTITATTDKEEGANYSALVDSEIVISGVAAPLVNLRRQMTGARLLFPGMKTITVTEPAPPDPFLLPVQSLSSLLQYSPQGDSPHRIHVRGRVTLWWPGQTVCIVDETAGLCIETTDRTVLNEGDLIDVAGFPGRKDYLPSITAATLKPAGSGGSVTPVGISAASALDTGQKDSGTVSQAAHIEISAANAFATDRNGELIRIEGTLVGKNRGLNGSTLLLSSGGIVFPAILPPDAIGNEKQLESSWADGSRVEVTGVFAAKVDEQRTIRQEGIARFESFQILLRSPQDVLILSAPSWWNGAHSLEVLGLSVLTMLAIFGYRESKTRREIGSLAYVEQRRGRILESINSSEPLAEILERITQLVSLRLNGAACWCQVADGAMLGNRPPSLASASLRTVEHPIAARSGPTLGAIYAAIHARTRPTAAEKHALAMAAELATLAIETSRLHSDLVHRSEFDLLTDVQNRFVLEKTLDEMIQAARQSAGIFGLIYIDLNEFKQVNDVYGHQAGDFYLQELTRRMKRHLRPGDTLARLGGDEFAVLVSDVHCRAGVEEIAARLECCFGDPFIGENYVLHGSASIGIALYPDDASTADSLLRAADAAMYVAKNTRLGKTRAPDSQPEGQLAPNDHP